MILGPKETRKRFVMGVVMLAVSIAALVALILAGSNRWWRAVLFFSFWMGALGLLQAKEKT